MKSPSSEIKIIIADDHAMFREGLKTLIHRDSKIKIVAEASNGVELLEKAHSISFDMIILDLSMPKMNGMQVLKEFSEKFVDKKIIILTMHNEFEFFQETLNAGIDGYILKEEASISLIKALHEIHSGGKYYSPGIFTEYQQNNKIDKIDKTDKQFNKLLLELLSRRELQIVKLIAEGDSSKEISNKLGISIRTVETHRYRIFEKLRIKKSTDLVKIAILNRLV